MPFTHKISCSSYYLHHLYYRYTLFSTKDVEFPYVGTSDSMEVIGALIVMSMLCMLGFASEELKIVCDGDTSIGKVNARS